MGSEPGDGSIFADLLPKEIAAEKAVLGAMMLSKDAIAEIADIVKEDNFREPRHRLVYRAHCRCSDTTSALTPYK